MFKKITATREKVKLMVGLTGPSGAGKTYSALQLAYGITGDWKKIALADTENKSALYYAGAKTGPWEHIEFHPSIDHGYHPLNWVKLIHFVEQDPNIEVLILDSISHEWNGVGGCVDIVNSLGNRFTDWSKVTPMHNRFIDKMRNSRLHIIATMRSKQDYAMEKNEKGKDTPRKVGLAPTQREGTDYEFGIIFDIEMSHYCLSSKDRTGLFANRGPFQLNAEIGKELLAWSREGKAFPQELSGLYTSDEMQQSETPESSTQTSYAKTSHMDNTNAPVIETKPYPRAPQAFDRSNDIHVAGIKSFLRVIANTEKTDAFEALASAMQGKMFQRSEISAAWDSVKEKFL